MKTLQKIALALVIVVFSSATINAQSYKHAVKNSKRVIIEKSVLPKLAAAVVVIGSINI